MSAKIAGYFFKSLTSLLSRRLIMAVIALYMVRNGFWGIIETLLTITDAHQITAFQSLAIAYLTAVVGIAMWYIGNTTWKGGLSVASNLQSLISSSSEKREEKVEIVNTQIVQEMAKRYADDESYRPLETLPADDGEEFR